MAPRFEADDQLLAVLNEGDLEVVGAVGDASNVALVGRVSLEGVDLDCVYKPVSGERPLWDFPDGTLAGREVSAFLLSDFLELGLVPPTVLRQGPFGPGMCQVWVGQPPLDPARIDPGAGMVDVLPVRGRSRMDPRWLPVLQATGGRGEPVVLAHRDDPRLRLMCLFDLLANNADRKGGHLLLGLDDRLFGIDHGICFHAEDKVRTVLWGFGGQPFDDAELDVLQRIARGLGDNLDGPLAEALAEHLTMREVARTARRVSRLASQGEFPKPRGGDWPPIPWPPF